jgi:hypothetical protein
LQQTPPVYVGHVAWPPGCVFEQSQKLLALLVEQDVCQHLQLPKLGQSEDAQHCPWPTSVGVHELLLTPAPTLHEQSCGLL